MAGGGIDTDLSTPWDDPAAWEWENLILVPAGVGVEASLVGA